MQNRTRGEWLRWSCVLPAAVIGGFVIRYVCGLVARVVVSGLNPSSESNITLLAQLLVYAATAAAFVLAGAFTAPRGRRTTAVILAAVSALLSLLTHVLSQRQPGMVNYLHLAAEISGAALAAGYLLFRNKPERIP